MDTAKTKSRNHIHTICLTLMVLLLLVFFFLPMINAGFSSNCQEPPCPKEKVTVFKYLLLRNN